MATLLYYAAESNASATLEHLKDRLDGGMHRQGLNKGPDGQGMLICAADRMEASRLRYHPEEQQWTLVPACGRPAYWVGVISGETPGPADLVRKKTLPGHLVELADGKHWLCPVARGQGQQDGRLVWYHTLPRSLILREDGTWSEGEVVHRWARLWQIAEAYWQARMGAADPEAPVGSELQFDFQGAAAAAAECLAVNYRLTPVEISLLDLLDTDSPRKILDSLIDWPTLVALAAELEKKTEPIVSVG